jgi:hypothetical protein
MSSSAISRVGSRRTRRSGPITRITTPAITLVQLFAFLIESLLDRGGLSAEARAHLRDVLARLEPWDDVGCADGTLTRNRYFFGKLMSVADFEEEQSYLRTKHATP